MAAFNGEKPSTEQTDQQKIMSAFTGESSTSLPINMFSGIAPQVMNARYKNRQRNMLGVV